jgi:hypothetical protein
MTTKTMGKADDLTRRVAMYRSEYGSTSLWEVGKDPDKPPLDNWVRVSEVLEITVTPLPAHEVVAGQLRALYSLRAKVADELGTKLARIDGQISSLRALPSATE